MPFEDIEPKVEKRERRWNIVSTIFPTSVADRVIDIEWARDQRQRREEVGSDFQSRIESLRELRDDLESDISTLRDQNHQNPDMVIKRISIRLKQAWELFDPVDELNRQYLRHEEIVTIDDLSDEFHRVEKWLNAYERVGKYADIAAHRLQEFDEQIKPYQDYGTYLTTPKEDDLRDLLDEIEANLERGFDAAGKTPLANKYLDRLTDLKAQVKENRQFVQRYNQEFVAKEAKRYERLFTDIDEKGNDLSGEQQEAVLHDDKYNLVVAGAGSGKTVTLTHRVAYLTQRRDTVPPNRILAISYTNNAASVMESRLASKFGITGVNTTTFHSLGKSIVESEWEVEPEVSVRRDRTNFIENTINRETDQADSEFKRQYFQFLKHFYDDIGTPAEFEEKESSVEKMTNEAKITLKQEQVRSKSEKEIADFLFLHQVEYEYQSLQEWVEDAPGRGAYRANFYLPKHGVVISHRPVQADGSVTSWGSASSYEDLESTVRWERERFKEVDDYRLVETYEFEAEGGRLRKALRARLVDALVVLDEMTYEKFVESVFDYTEHKWKIINLFSSFIQNARQLDLSPSELDDRLPDSPPKEKAFGKCVSDLYQRYCSHLETNDLIDFPGMLYQAIKATKLDPEKYQDQYDQILVDEFQDISRAEVELLKCYVGPESDTKLFCVGDDWQSIFSFAGSEVDYFINFDEYFDTPQTTELSKNYRCPASVVHAGNDLIANNEQQLDKEAVPASEKDTDIEAHVLQKSPFADKYEWDLYPKVLNLIQKYLAAGAPPEEIMVLSRTNNFYHGLERKLDDAGIKASMSPEDEENPEEFVRLYSVHKSKGDEADHVIIIHAVEHIVGFPSQVEDDDLLEPVRIAPKENMAEERRLFYVALTRSSGTLDIVTSDGHESRFLKEIKHHVTTPTGLADLNGNQERIDIDRGWLRHSFGSGNAQTQSGLISDGSGTSRFVIWEDSPHDPLEEDVIYQLDNAQVAYNDFNEEYEIRFDQYTEIDVVDVRE